SLNTYVPSSRLETFRFGVEAPFSVALPPERFVQAYDAIDPSLSEPLPRIVAALVGGCIVSFGAALATRVWFEPAFTERSISSNVVAPLLSLTVNRKIYVPSTNRETVGFDEFSPIRITAPTERLVEVYNAIEPPGTPALPEIVTE